MELLFLHYICGPLVLVELILHHICRLSLVSIKLILYYIFGPLLSIGFGFKVVNFSVCISIAFIQFSFSISKLLAIDISSYQFCLGRLSFFSVINILTYIESTCQFF